MTLNRVRKTLAHLRVRDQVDVALPIPGLGVGESVVLLREWPKRLGQQHDLGRGHRELASARTQNGSGRADPIAEVHLLDRRESIVAYHVDAREELQVACGIADDEEDHLPLVALGDQAPRDADDIRGLGTGLKLRVLGLQPSGACAHRPAIAVGLQTGRSKRIESGTAYDERVVGAGRAIRRAAVLVSHGATG